MKVLEMMTTNVIVVEPNTTLREASEKMEEADIGFLPVCDGERLQGAITDRDIVVRGLAAGTDPDRCTVRDIMSDSLAYIYADQEAVEAARLMEARQIRRLVVLDRSKRLAGILTLGDISTHSFDQELAGEVLERVSEPAEGFAIL